MPTIIIKPTRRVDFYVVWSTVVEAPVLWGTRDDLLSANGLLSKAERLPARFDRADAFSSSQRYGHLGWDEDTVYVYEQRGLIRRSRIPDLIDLLSVYSNNQAEFELEVMDLLEPFDDDDDDDDNDKRLP